MRLETDLGLTVVQHIPQSGAWIQVSGVQIPSVDFDHDCKESKFARSVESGGLCPQTVDYGLRQLGFVWNDEWLYGEGVAFGYGFGEKVHDMFVEYANAEARRATREARALRR